MARTANAVRRATQAAVGVGRIRPPPLSTAESRLIRLTSPLVWKFWMSLFCFLFLLNVHPPSLLTYAAAGEVGGRIRAKSLHTRA